MFRSNAERPAKIERGAVPSYSTNVELSGIEWSLTCHTFTFPHFEFLDIENVIHMFWSY